MCTMDTNSERRTSSRGAAPKDLWQPLDGSATLDYDRARCAEIGALAAEKSVELKRRAQRGHPGSQLPAARDLRGRRLRRRLARAGAQGDDGRRRRHRLLRRPLHGRDGEDPEPGEDGAASRSARRLLARRQRRRAEELVERRDELRKVYPDLAGGRLRQHHGGGEGGGPTSAARRRTPCEIVEALPTEHILFVPDENLAEYVQPRPKKNDHRLERQLLRAPPDHARSTSAR